MLLTVTGTFVGLNPVDPVGAAVGVVDGAWVTVNVVLATSPSVPVTVNMYSSKRHCRYIEYCTWNIIRRTCIYCSTFDAPKTPTET